MNTTLNTEALQKALIIAAGDAINSPVLTTEAYIRMQTCFWANLVAMLDAWRYTPGSGVQVYGLAIEIRKARGPQFEHHQRLAPQSRGQRDDSPHRRITEQAGSNR